MNLLAKLKETSTSVIPILVIVLILKLTVAPIGWTLLAQFFIGGVLIIIGLSVFLLGTDIGILPVGQKVGSALVYKRNFTLMLIVGFLVGFLITIAEPDVQVLARQVATVDASISKFLLVVMIGLGVGLFVAIGFGRIILQISYRWMLVLFYIVVFVLAFFTDSAYLSIAFDAGGVTTGPMTVPFILSLGIGVASVRKSKSTEDDSFGMVGLASIGPIMAVLLMGILTRDATGSSATVMNSAAEGMSIAKAFINLIPETIVEVVQALGPLALIFIIFQITLLHMPPHQVAKMVTGLIYAFIGLVIFLVGVNGGFLPVGTSIGGLIGSRTDNWILIPIGFILGAMVVLAEPAVWVLTIQVEEVSGGHIKRPVMLASLSIGVAVAVCIAMIRVITGISIWWFLIPGYTLALTLTFFCPKLFTAIAFDAGGVASGPMSSTFILSFTLGASSSAGGNPITDAFGVVAMIAMTPLIAIQILGLLFKHKERTSVVPHLEGSVEGTVE
ncbi:MAG TPA: DUF1538 domain-containing protein [Spirochaetia bacterium]|nr:DUF1538 domain-containing protein [Spirochaetia bacterium]